jgi:hypothetical protein
MPYRAAAWRSIDTAPKDGTPVLVNVAENVQLWGYDWLHAILGENVTIAAWMATPGHAAELGWVTVAAAFALIAGARSGNLGRMRVSPTHWMPLPPPPGRAAAGHERNGLLGRLPLSTRARNVLVNQGFTTLDDLRSLAETPDDEILRWPKVGHAVLREIRAAAEAAASGGLATAGE